MRKYLLDNITFELSWVGFLQSHIGVELCPVENLGAWNGGVFPLVPLHLRQNEYVSVECQYVSYRSHDDIDKDEDKGDDGKDDSRPELRQLGCVLLLHLDQVLHRPGWVLDEVVGVMAHLHDEELKEAEAAVVGDRV